MFQPWDGAKQRSTRSLGSTATGNSFFLGGGSVNGTKQDLLKNFLYDLNSAIAPKKVRMEGLRFAVEFFCHGDEAKHNDEVDFGAVQILLSKLAFSYSIHPLDEEVAHASSCLKMILSGCSRDWVQRAWEDAGDPCLPLLVDMIRHPTATNNVAVGNVLKILRHFSRILSAMVPIANSPGAINALLAQLDRLELNDDEDDENTEQGSVQYQRRQTLEAELTERRVDALATLVNLACAEENKFMMANHPALLEDVITVANNDPSSPCREHAATIIMNLAYHDSNKEHMAHMSNLLDSLIILMGDVSPNTRRYASAALFTLSCVASNAGRLSKDRRIIESLRVVMLEDTYELARINAAEALCTMAKLNMDDTVERMGCHPQLLESLGEAAAVDDNADVRNFAAAALEWLATDLNASSPCHPELLAALVRASVWRGTVSIAEALKGQSSHSENRRPMAEHPGLLDALADMAMRQEGDEEQIYDCIIWTIERLSTEPTTRNVLAAHEGIMEVLSKGGAAVGSSAMGPSVDKSWKKTKLLGDGTDVVDGGTTALLKHEAMKNLSSST